MIAKIRVWFAKQTYLAKLLLLLLPIIFATMMLMAAISIQKANSLIVTQHKSLYTDQCAKIASEIEVYIDQAIATTETVLYDDTVYSYIFGDTASLSAFDQFSLQSGLATYSSAICSQNGYRKLRLYVRDKFGVRGDQGSQLRLLEQFNDIVMLEGHQLNSRYDQTAVSGVYYYSNSNSVDPTHTTPLVSVVRYVIDGTLDNVAGIIAIDLTADELLKAWRDSFEADLCTLKLTDQYGAVIDVCGGGEPVFNEGMRIELPVGNYGWMLTASISYEVLYSGNREIACSLLAASLGVCALLMTAVVLITSRMTRRLVNLKDSICQSATSSSIREINNPIADEGAEDGDEVDKLICAYNHMLQRIDTLSLEFEKSIARETESRMLVLQSQINPHFLYNTLAVIKSYIEINDAMQASDLLMRLSGYFRHALSKGAYVITLREELEIAAKYLDIQKIVCCSSLDYSIDVSARIGEILTPKFLLQPFVENAVLYGANGSAQPTRIHIWGRANQSTISLYIDDNGPGISDQVRSVLMGEREPAPDEHIGYGIRNVRNRLKLFYGETSDLRFTSLPSGGTRVEIMIHGLERSDCP